MTTNTQTNEQPAGERAELIRYLRDSFTPYDQCHSLMIKAAALLEADAQRPIDMVLYCPKCGTQHIDAPEESIFHEMVTQPEFPVWTNPPHKSHLCHGCGHIWRPSDHPTNGVERTASGKDADTTPVQRPALKPLTDEQITEGVRNTGAGSVHSLGAAFKLGVQYAEAAHGIKEKP